MIGLKATPECALAPMLCCASLAGRLQLMLVLVTVTLLTAMIAFCGTLEASPMADRSEDVQALNQENVAGPVEIELLADCQRTERALQSSFSRPCPNNN